MATENPNLSNNQADRRAFGQVAKAPSAAKQAVVGAADAPNAVVSDQQWLEQSQQVWADQRAKELELARAEKSGDRVLQLSDSEQLGDAAGQSLVVAQAKTSEDDRKAAAKNDDRKAAAAKDDDDDGGLWWDALRLGLVGLAIGGAKRGDSTPVEPDPEPETPRDPGEELLVYSNEDEDDNGDRAESGDTDTNTDNGPYTTVRVAAYDNNDTATLDDDGNGDGGALYVEFEDRTDLLLEVSADGDSSLASADISTDVSFSGEMNVHASGDDAEASLDFDAYTSGQATHSIDMTVVADGDSSDIDVLIDLEGEDGIEASFDAVVSADGYCSDVTLDVYVSSDSADALLSGDVAINAGGVSADAYGYVDVLSDSDDVTLIGNLSASTSAQSADAGLDVYVEITNEDSSEDVAMLSADIQVTVEDGSENASADVYVEVSIDTSAEASFSGDVDVTTERGAVNSYASAEINLYGEDGYAHFSGDVLASTDGVSTDAGVQISLEGDESEMEGHIAAVAGVRDSLAEVSIDISADVDAWVWGSTTVVEDSNDADGVIGSTENDTAAEWSTLAAAQDASADLYASIEANDNISAELNVTAQASRSSADAEVDIDMFASNDIDLLGNESNVWTLSIDSDDVAGTASVGEDYTQTVEAAQFDSMASANASSDVSLDMDAFNSIEANVNFMVDARGRDADAETSVDISTDGYVVMAGGWESSNTVTLSYDWTEVGNDIVASGEDIAIGEDYQYQAAEWGVTASCVDANADFYLNIDGDTDYDVELLANLSVQATDAGGAAAYIDLNDSDDLDTVYIGGEKSANFLWEVSYVSDDAQDNLLGEDINFTIASAEDASNWITTADDGADASVDVIIDAFASVDLHVNMVATASADASADIELEIDTEGAVLIGGAIYGSADFVVASSESDVYQSYTSGEDSTTTYEAATWEAVADGESGDADVSIDIDNVSTNDADFDIIISVDLLTEASATDSTADIDIGIDADSYLRIDGGRTYTYSSLDSVPSDDVSVDYSTEVSTEYAADWEAIASGVNTYSSIEVGASGEDIDFRVDLTGTASGADSMAGVDVELYASDEIHVSGEVTYSSRDDFGPSNDDYASTDTQNAVWTFTASGEAALADFEFSAYASGSIDLDVDVTATATGADSVSSVDIYAESYSEDVNMGWEDDANVTVTATGSNSLAYAEIDLLGEDVGYDGNITVTANAASGLDADAVMEINLDASEESYFYGDINVSALGADNDATLVMHVTSSYDSDSSDVGGNINVKAVEGIASVSVSVDGSFDAFVSLDADEGGEVVMTIVADTMDGSGDIYVYTDNDGEVTLNMDVNDYGSNEDIDVYGDEGGVFNLVLQDGFDVSVDLSDDVQGYAGQFNLVVETPLNFDFSSEDAFYSIEIEGFDATGLVIDTIDFKGAEFNGTYIDATVVSDTYSDEYTSFDTFLTEAGTALDGEVDYFFGTDGTDGWLAVDGDGEGIDYVIELLGVTNIDWDSVLSTQGQYTVL